MAKLERFDLAIIDIRLPGMNGDQLIQKMHQDFLSLRCIIHTGSSEFELTSRLNSIGIYLEYVFLKPQMSLHPMNHMINQIVSEP